MTDEIREQIDRVGRRYRELRNGVVCTAVYAALAVVCFAVWVYARQHPVAAPGWLCTAFVAVGFGVMFAVDRLPSRTRDPRWVARRIERRFPDLDSRLLTALDQHLDPANGRLSYLQRRVVDETLDHASRKDWTTIVPQWQIRTATCVQLVTLATLAFLCVMIARTALQPTSGGKPLATGNVTVEPGDTTIERGSGLLVLARFAGPLPGDVRLLTKSAAGEVLAATMSKSLDDPVFAGRVARVDADVQYAVQYGGTQSPWFTAKVFETPELKQADATLDFPAYTKLPSRREQDVRSLTAVEGTVATVRLKLNKPVTAAELRPATGNPIKLTIDPARPDEATAKIDLKHSQKLTLALTDADGRHNKSPAAEFALHVNPNRPPELKPVSPGRDVDVSPIQEFSTGVRVSDDFGVSRVGVSYGLAGRPATDVTLASDVPGGQKRDVSQLVALEPIGAKPDELLSYYFWAEDVGPDGMPRRTASDMYFAEVRPFEEIFRQGQQQSEGEQRQQQQNGQSANGQQAEQLAELQKQIIAATWKIVRRETATAPTDQFAPDVTLVRDSQTSARGQAAALGERLTDAKSAGFLKTVLQHMDRATADLADTLKSNTPRSLSTALSSEQAAYQALLRLRAREFEVTRGNRQQQGQQSASSASSRRQQQLDQLRLEQDANRYETQRTATPQTENPQQRETRQVLNRLKELAQRQEDLNRQMQETNSALDRAKDDAQREEAQRQLARLRDQQAEQLRDTDELRDRLNRPENQDNLADARQQIEQTRENVRRASEALQQNRVPEAAASGARAGEQLNQLRDQVRRSAAGELAEAMTDLRQQARDLDANQQKLSEQLKDADAKAKPSLRDGDDRKQLADQLGRQKQDLDKLTDAMQKTIESSENSEPLVSRQLYETLRQSGQQQTDKALDVSRQLLDRGFTNEARQAEAEAAKGVSQLRQGVEQAATGVLGDEAEALRRAKGELDRLADELQREVARQRPRDATAVATPTTRPAGRLAAGGPATRPGNTGSAASPATRPTQIALGGPPRAGGSRDATTRPDNTSPGSSSDGRPTDRQRSQQNGGRGRESTSRPGERGNGPSERGGQPGGQNDQPGDQTGRPGEPREVNGGRPESNGQRGEREAAQGGQRPQSGQSPRTGERGGEGQPNANNPAATPPDGAAELRDAGQPGDAARPGDRPAGPGLRGQGVASGRQPGDRAAGAEQRGGGQRGGDDPRRDDERSRPPGDVQPDDRRETADRAGGGGGDPNAPNDGRTAAVPAGTDGPLTGGSFRDWSDRLRDVEEMIADPKLRDRVARVRERARDVRAEVKRHAKQPNWDVVQDTVVKPLDELRDQVAQELLRRTSPDALVPLDREGVPPQYAEQVRQYYERLGAGR